MAKILEVRIKSDSSNIENTDIIEEGYFLTERDLLDLLRDYIVETHAGTVSSSHIFLESWLKKH